MVEKISISQLCYVAAQSMLWSTMMYDLALLRIESCNKMDTNYCRHFNINVGSYNDLSTLIT